MQGITKAFRTFRRAFAGYLVQTAVVFLNSMPNSIAKLVGHVSGSGMYWISTKDRNRIHSNLDRVYADSLSAHQKKQLAKTICRNLASAAVEAIRIRNMTQNQIIDSIDTNGFESIVEKTFSRKRSIMIITGHYGNWELFAARMALLGPLTVLARKNSNPKIEDVIQEMRDRNHVRVLDRSDPKAPKEMIKMGREGGHILGILMDQDTTRINGIFSPFMNIDAYTPSGPASIAVRNLYDVYVVVQRPQTNDQHKFIIKGPVILPDDGDRNEQIQELTDRFNQVLSSMILEAPEYWVWNHRRWRHRPDSNQAERRS